jgi:peptidoglycan/xylan/chitin deacetylase (PgdA/CDA1 family)
MRVLETVIPRRFIGFCYHAVSDRPLPHLASLYPCKSVAQFKRDLEFIQRRYRVVGYDELEQLRGDATGCKPCVVITFDDGLAECYDVVRAVLLEYGLPAIFFVTTDFLDNRRLFYRQKVALAIDSYTRMTSLAATTLRSTALGFFDSPPLSSDQFVARLKAASWEDEHAIDATCELLGVDVEGFLRSKKPYMTRSQVQTLATDGFTIGAHGIAHHLIGAMTDSEARAEIVEASSAVMEVVGLPTVPFAFPFNGRNVSRDMLRTLRETSPRLGLFFDSMELARDQDFVVNRLVVDDPAGALQGRSNLPARIRRAYAREMVRPFVMGRTSDS